MTGRDERLYELLASKATEGLSSGEADRLDELLIEFPQVDPQELDRAAAAVHLALLGPELPMPAAIKQRLAVAGRRQAASRRPRESGPQS